MCRVGHVFKISKWNCPTEDGHEGRELNEVENRDSLLLPWLMRAVRVNEAIRDGCVSFLLLL